MTATETTTKAAEHLLRLGEAALKFIAECKANGLSTNEAIDLFLNAAVTVKEAEGE